LIKLASNDDSAADAGFAGVGHPAQVDEGRAWKVIMAREAGRTFRRRAAARIRTGTSRITTSDAAVTPRPPRERGRPDSNRRIFRLTSDCSCR
jgi:hypothetical protein